MDVVVQADGRQGGGAAALAGAGTALAALDPHDVAQEALPVRAAEAQAYGADLGGGAAPAVRAGAAGAGPVPPRRGAARERDPLRLPRTYHLLALLPSLNKRNGAKTDPVNPDSLLYEVKCKCSIYTLYVVFPFI